MIWVNGPGGLTPNQEGWATVSQQYQFVEDFARLRTLVQGVDNLQRFDYWDQSLQSLRVLYFAFLPGSLLPASIKGYREGRMYLGRS